MLLGEAQHPMVSRSSLLLPLAVLLLGLSSCRDEQVVSYKIPKEKDPELPMAAADAQAPADASGGAPADGGMPGSGAAGPMQAPADASGSATPASGPMAGGNVATASGAPLLWTAPAGWKVKTASMMRKGSYDVPSGNATDKPGDMSITAFPGDVGGEVANVNRWRGQVGLQPLSADEAARSLQRLQINGLPVAVLDISAQASAGDHRILGAMVPYAGSTWFFKLTGTNAALDRAKPDFLNFLSSIRAR